MKEQFLQYIRQVDRRHLLVFIAALLIVLNIGRWGTDFYQEKTEARETKLTLLKQYRKAAPKLPALERRLARLEAQHKGLDNYLFSGNSEEHITSAMQIKLQDLISKAGLAPEFIQPLRAKQSGGTADQGDMGIKIRMAGSLNNLLQFLKNLYSSKNLFKVESFTIKPYRQTELKIFMEVRGFYKIEKEAQP